MLKETAASKVKRPKAAQPKEDKAAADMRRLAQQEILKKTVSEKVTEPSRVANALGVTAQTVYGWGKTGKIATEHLAPLAQQVGCTVDELLTGVAPASSSFDSKNAGSLPEAFETIASLLSELNPSGHTVVRDALIRLVDSPSEHAAFAAGLADQARHFPARNGPKPSRKVEPPIVEESTPKKAEGRARLVLKQGGGQKRQFDLPFKGAPDPFNESFATVSERRWYESLKRAPKAGM